MLKFPTTTIRNTCHNEGYHGRVCLKKFCVIEKYRTKRLDFAKKYEHKTEDYWKAVVWTDESKFELFVSKKKPKVWRKKNVDFDPKILTPTVKHWGGSVCVCRSMNASGVGTSHYWWNNGPHTIYQYIKKSCLPVWRKCNWEKTGFSCKTMIRNTLCTTLRCGFCTTCLNNFIHPPPPIARYQPYRTDVGNIGQKK